MNTARAVWPLSLSLLKNCLESTYKHYMNSCLASFLEPVDFFILFFDNFFFFKFYL